MNNASDSKLKITFLLDKRNNWIEDRLRRSGLLNSSPKYDATVSHDPSNVTEQDIVFILGYTRILVNAFLVRNKLNLVIHESDLPKGKGFAPIQWQILEGKNQIPICLIEAAEKVDAGDILGRGKIELKGDELFEEIRDLQAQATFELIRQFLKTYPDYTREKQNGSESMYPKRTPADGELNVDKSIREQFNQLRIGNNEEWPSFFYLKGQKYILKIAKESGGKK